MILTPEQQAAVRRQGQDVCVVAGPGSGKTTVLVERYAWLVAEQGLRPDEILAITFTEKAAHEIKHRLALRFASDAEVKHQIERAPVSTIHGFCARLLRRHAIAAGRPLVALLLLILVAQAQVHATGAKSATDIEYIRLGSETMVRFPTIDLIDDPGDGPEVAMLLVELHYAIRPSIKAKTATINILASSLNGFLFDEGHELTLTIDGTKFPLGEMHPDLHKEETIPGSKLVNHSEALILTIPYESFAPLLQAKNANIRIGKRKFGLSGAMRKKLREYAAQITDWQENIE